MSNCSVFWGDAPAGGLSWSRDGLYWRFDAVLSLCPGVRKLKVRDAAGHSLVLGTPVPQGDAFRLRRRISATELARMGFSPEGGMTACLLPAPPGAAPEAPAEVPAGPAASPETALVLQASGAAEPFVPGRPLSLAAWYRDLTVVRDEARVCVLLSGLRKTGCISDALSGHTTAIRHESPDGKAART